MRTSRAPAATRCARNDPRRSSRQIPEGITPHSLRHTFASLLIAKGEDQAYCMGQLGHTDPGFTLRVYAHAMRFSDDERAHLKALVEGREWAPAGTGTAEEPVPPGRLPARTTEPPPWQGFREVELGGLERQSGGRTGSSRAREACAPGR